MSSNPLSRYFRQPAIYIKLPSGGQFYPEGALVVTPNSEYPVLPMTTMDEITYRTPDALFNGSATISVIQSCVPNIRDAWRMPSMDIDTVLVAIRIATYGHEMSMTTKCPACSTEADYGVDLRRVMENITAPDYERELHLGDLAIYFRPMSYSDINENSMAQFEDQKILQALQETPGDEEKRRTQMGDVLRKITRMTTQALVKNIALIQSPQARVTDRDHITEWLENCDRTTFVAIRDHIIDAKRQGELQPLHIKCNNCGHEYDQQFTLDMSNFFEAAS